MKIKATLFIAFFLLLAGTLKSQSYYFRHYQVENGLSNNTVGCSLQDKKGFLWFGTKDGLNRFDGYTFKVFQNDRDDPKSIGSNFIISIHEDQDGVLWVGTDRGLFRYDAATESFSLLNIAPVDEIRGIQMDKNHCLWLVVRNRLYQCDLKKGMAKLYAGLESTTITSICSSPEGSLWLSTTTGYIKRLDPSTLSMTSFDVFPKSERIPGRWIQKLYNPGDGNILIGTSNHGMKIFDLRNLSYRDVHMFSAGQADVFVRDFIKYSDKEYWIATESGVFIYNKETGNLLNLKKDYNNPYSISDNAAYTLCRDKEGGIWIGTYFGGVNYYPKQYTNFKKYFPQFGRNAISGNAIREITSDHKGNLWIGTEDAGLNKLDTKTGMFTSYHPEAKDNRIAHTNIHGLLCNGDELWVGTFHRGLDVLNIKTGKVVRHYSSLNDGLNSDFVCCLLKTREGKIIAATDRGLCYFNASNTRFIPIKDIPLTFYTRIYEDNYGTIWAGTYNEGLYYFNPKTRKSGIFQYKSSEKNSLGGNRINWIFEDSSKALWIATQGGLCRFNRDKNTFTNYTTKDGFPSNIIYAVQEAEKKNFWISTSKGLV